MKKTLIAMALLSFGLLTAEEELEEAASNLGSYWYYAVGTSAGVVPHASLGYHYEHNEFLANSIAVSASYLPPDFVFLGLELSQLFYLGDALESRKYVGVELDGFLGQVERGFLDTFGGAFGLIGGYRYTRNGQTRFFQIKPQVLVMPGLFGRELSPDLVFIPNIVISFGFQL